MDTIVIFHNDNSTSSKTLKKKMIDKKIPFNEVVVPKRNHNTFTKNVVLEVDGELLGLVDSLNWVNDYIGGES